MGEYLQAISKLEWSCLEYLSEFSMSEPIVLKSDDPLLKRLKFKPYRNTAQRRVAAFMPTDDQSQTMDIVTPWGSTLTAKKGDLLISELDKPDDMWPIDAQIFDETYLITAPGFCIKRGITFLAPLTEVTANDEDQMVIIHTLEGPETVRAGDFLLARGVKGEIWPYPIEKAAEIMRPVE
jgi:hypothetical protein